MKAITSSLSIVKVFREAGHSAYYAGGWVRDFIMGRPSDDIDIATSASVSEIQALFPKNIPVGVAFGIVIVPLEGHNFEVATFRTDVSYEDGRRPTAIQTATAEEDASRRDFTVNGMFYDPIKDEILDYVGGREDISKKLIRAIGDPEERFREDRLRMMRAVRYATRFEFEIDPKTLEAIKLHSGELLKSVAMERIWQEFEKMSKFSHFDKGLILLHKLGLLQVIFPSLRSLSSAEIKEKVKYIEQFPKKTPCIAELLELFPEISEEELEEFCRYLKLSRKESDFASFLLHARRLVSMPPDWLNDLELYEWAHFYASIYAKHCLEIIAVRFPSEKREAFLTEHQMRFERMNVAIERIRNKDPVVKAADLFPHGIKPGVKLGQILKEAERIAINQGWNDPEKIIDQLKKHPLWD